jgi:hypothetical protein
MVLAAPGLLLTPPPSSSPPKTPVRTYSAQIRSQNEEKNPPKPYLPLQTRTGHRRSHQELLSHGSTNPYIYMNTHRGSKCLEPTTCMRRGSRYFRGHCYVCIETLRHATLTWAVAARLQAEATTHTYIHHLAGLFGKRTLHRFQDHTEKACPSLARACQDVGHIPHAQSCVIVPVWVSQSMSGMHGHMPLC